MLTQKPSGIYKVITCAAGESNFNSRAQDIFIVDCGCVSVPGNSVYKKCQFTKKWWKEEKNCHTSVILTIRAELGLGDHLIQSFIPTIILLKTPNTEQRKVKTIKLPKLGETSAPFPHVLLNHLCRVLEFQETQPENH